MGDHAGEEEADDRKLCVVCASAPREVVFTACGHFLLCSDCTVQLLVRRKPCPTCRVPVLAEGGTRRVAQPSEPAGLAEAPSFQPDAVDPAARERALAPAQLLRERADEHIATEEEEAAERALFFSEALRSLRIGDAALTRLELSDHYIGDAGATQLAERPCEPTRRSRALTWNTTSSASRARRSWLSACASTPRSPASAWLKTTTWATRARRSWLRACASTARSRA